MSYKEGKPAPDECNPQKVVIEYTAETTSLKKELKEILFLLNEIDRVSKKVPKILSNSENAFFSAF